MQSTGAKIKNKAKRIVLIAAAVILSVCVLLISFGGGLGIPDWNDVFAFFGIYADLDADLSVSFINVGTADACCIKCGEKTVLIDSGTSNSYDKLSAYLRRNGFEKFDAVIVSHPDSDHIGGMADIIEDFGADVIYMSAMPENLVPDGEDYKRLNNSIKENKLKAIDPKITSKTRIGNMELDFISPTKIYDNRNDNSLVVRLTYKENSFLFTGDISKDVENDLLNSTEELNSDVLKVAHHGSKTSSTEDFLKAVSPEISVVSVGSSDDSLPDYNTMARINNYSQSLYRTDKDRTVVITSDGKNLNVQTHA